MRSRAHTDPYDVKVFVLDVWPAGAVWPVSCTSVPQSVNAREVGKNGFGAAEGVLGREAIRHPLDDGGRLDGARIIKLRGRGTRAIPGVKGFIVGLEEVENPSRLLDGESTPVAPRRTPEGAVAGGGVMGSGGL